MTLASCHMHAIWSRDLHDCSLMITVSSECHIDGNSLTDRSELVHWLQRTAKVAVHRLIRP